MQTIGCMWMHSCKLLPILILSFCLVGCGASEEAIPTESRPLSFWEQVDADIEQNLKAMNMSVEQKKPVSVGVFFEKVAKDSGCGFELFRDIRTDVMYCYSIYRGGYAGGCTLTVMVNSDGLPLTYADWIMMEE